METLQKLNSEAFNLETVADPSIPYCTVNFDFGIAEENNFNYLNKGEVDRILKLIHREQFHTMDFLCAIRYYKTEAGRRHPLRFDYYVLRLAFNEEAIEAQVFHERGPRHMSPEDVIDLIANKINEKSQKRTLKKLETT